MLKPVAVDPLAKAFELCKQHAVVEGAFSETLLRHWFEASWSICSEFSGLIYPSQRVSEHVLVDQYTGSIRLSYKPSSWVEIYAGVTLVATLPPNSPCLNGMGGCPALCCNCSVLARYTIGTDDIGAQARFIQAVVRVFTYIAENRGEVQQAENLLGASGAKTFLGPELTYVM